jgi:hypothetical protein
MYSGCVSVALGIQHAKLLRRIFHLWPVRLYHIFPRYFINNIVNRIKLFKKKTCSLIFFAIFFFARNISYCKKNSARYCYINVPWYSCRVPLTVVRVEGNWILSTGFRKICYQISWNFVQWGPNCSMRTDGQDVADSRVSKFSEKRLKWSLKIGLRGRGPDSPGSGQGQMAGRSVIKVRILQYAGNFFTSCGTSSFWRGIPLHWIGLGTRTASQRGISCVMQKGPKQNGRCTSYYVLFLCSAHGMFCGMTVQRLWT